MSASIEANSSIMQLEAYRDAHMQGEAGAMHGLEHHDFTAKAQAYPSMYCLTASPPAKPIPPCTASPQPASNVSQGIAGEPTSGSGRGWPGRCEAYCLTTSQQPASEISKCIVGEPTSGSGRGGPGRFEAYCLTSSKQPASNF